MNNRTKMITFGAMLAALCYVITFFSSQMPPVVLFLKYDPKDIVLALSGLIWGPIMPLAVAPIVGVLEMFTYSTTGWIGCVMNIVSSYAFALPAALIYRKKKSLTGAVIGLLSGGLLMITVMLLWNYLLTPLYMDGITREQISGMLIPMFLPFNALKGGLNAGFTFLLYKPVTTALRRSNLIERKESPNAPTKKPVFLWFAAGMLIVTCILFILAWKGVI